MARTRHNLLVRLGVAGGGQTKAELASVGTSGERSMRRIDRASLRASRGLGTLSDRAATLRSRMRLLNGAIAGVAGAAAIGGLAALVRRSIDAADAIAKTADAIGISTDALQELRFAADLSGVSVESLDRALKFATKAIGELRTRTSSELATALKDFDEQLLSNIRSAGSVEEAIEMVFQRMGAMEDATRKAALAKAVFGRAGMDLVNIVRGEAGALDAMRRQARELGIVLDEELLRGAERAKDQLTILATVISANVNQAVLAHADAIADLAQRFSEGLPALIDWVEAFGRWAGLIAKAPKERLAEVKEEIAGLEAFMSTPVWRFMQVIDFSGRKSPQVVRLERLQAEREELERLIENMADLPSLETPGDDTAGSGAAPGGQGDAAAKAAKAAEERARRILQIEKSLQQQLFQLRHQGAERIRAEFVRTVTELERLIAPDRSNIEEINRLTLVAAAVQEERLAELARREEASAARRAAANQRVIAGLGAERDALAMTGRQRTVATALRRLSAEATEAERRQVAALAGALYDEREAREARDRARAAIEGLAAERALLAMSARERAVATALRQLSADATEDERRAVRELAGALYDESQAMRARNAARAEANRLRAEAEALTRRMQTAQEDYAGEMERLRELLAAGAIDQGTFARAAEEAHDAMLDASRDWADGVRRALRDWRDEATDAARQFERATTRALAASEDAFAEWALTGKLSARELFDAIAEEALRAAWRMAVIRPLTNALTSFLGAAPGIGAAPVAHGGGVIGADALALRPVPVHAFADAPRYHRGGILPGETPAILRRGEGVFTPAQMRALAPVAAVKPEVHVALNIKNTAPGVQATADWRREAGGDLNLDVVIAQMEGGMARRIDRGEGLAPTLERRYGLNRAAGSIR